MFRQGKYVLFAVSKRRKNHLNDVQTVVQVEPEFTFLNCFGKLSVGSGHDPHIHLDIPNASQTAESLLLQDSQQLDLDRKRHFADFIQEDGAPGGDLENSRLGSAGIGECAFLVSEKLAFEQSLGNSRAIQGHEGSF